MPAPSMKVSPRVGQEGARWYNKRPSGKDVASWFKTVPIHEGLRHDNYVGGITLIQQSEKADEVIGFNESSGSPLTAEVWHQVWVPAPTVPARVAYWRDLLALHASEWIGVIEPVVVEGAQQKYGLPHGFFGMAVTDNQAKTVHLVGCSMRARILYAESAELVDGRLVGVPVLEGPTGTKVVPLLSRRGWPDENAVMKAESGALGRALGLAGMLVVPGAGAATAEDLQEAISGQNSPPVASPELPSPAPAPAPSAEPLTGLEPTAEMPLPEPDERRARLVGLVKQLEEHPTALKHFREWAKERKITLGEATDKQLDLAIAKASEQLGRVQA